MPTYEYLCPTGHPFELFQKMSDKPRAKCPTCGKVAARQMSAGAGLHFKGSGFYITDYGKDGKGPRKEPAKAESASGTEAKPETAVEKPAAEKPVADATPKPKAHGKKSK